MMSLNNFHKPTGLLMGVLFSALMAACSTPTPVEAPKQEAPAPVQNISPPPVPVPAPEPKKVEPPVTPAANLPAHLDPKNILSQQRSVYFDFDQFVIKSDSTAVIERHGKYLAGNPNLTIKVEGNTDERGGREYNLALGQKRAEAVVRALKAFGVKDSQVEAVSFGKEKPKAMGHSEAAWTENRRVDLNYGAK